MREFRFVITPFCNYHCFFCHGESAGEQFGLMLRPSDYEFIGQISKEMGWTTATITGGEPLISPIFRDICERLKNAGLRLTVVTNASLLARPQEMLKDISQINVSLHTMRPEIYKQITQIDYPLSKVLDSIAATRALLPNLSIHLNYTVIKGLNDSDEDFESLLKFANELNAEAKFIDLSTEDKSIETTASEIINHLLKLGFKVVEENLWQSKLERNGERTRVTKCPFNGRYVTLPVRDIFVNTDGTLYKSYGGYLSINALNEIKSRDKDKFISKVEVLLPRQG